MSKYIYDVKTGKVVLISKSTNEIILPIQNDSSEDVSSFHRNRKEIQHDNSNITTNNPNPNKILHHYEIRSKARISANISKGKVTHPSKYQYNTFVSKHDPKTYDEKISKIKEKNSKKCSNKY